MLNFEHHGYFREYYVNNKYIGQIQVEQDRELTGYTGRKTETLMEQIILDNGKKIKAGTEVMTMLYPLCGKTIKS